MKKETADLSFEELLALEDNYTPPAQTEEELKLERKFQELLLVD